MGSILRENDLAERISGRGISILRYGGKFTAKSDFRCSLGHEWSAKGYSVAGGTGCPICFLKPVINIGEAEKSLLSRGIRLLSASGKTMAPAFFECLKCGYEWTTTLGAVVRSSGCRKCKGLVKRTYEEALALISPRGIGLSDYCGRSAGISTFVCQCGNKWKTTLTSVLSGRGCPSCASYGFDKNKPAVFYIYKVTGNVNFIGYGVTNSYKSRKYKHGETFNKEGLVYEEIALFNFGTGKEALALENSLKERYSYFSVDIKSFKTESAPIEELESIMLCAMRAKSQS